MVSILSHLGQVIAIALSAAIIYLVSRLIRNDSLSPQALVLVSVFTLIALPFFLPHMHEKYFYLADMVAITYAFIRPSKWYIPVLVISASTLSYMPFLSGAIPEFGKFVTSVAFGAVLILIALASLFPRIRAKWMDVILQKSPRLVNQPIINNY